MALKEQYLRKQNIINKGKEPLNGCENLVFVTRNNKPITVFLVTESLDATVKRINKNNPDLKFERITPHTFRHTFATGFIETGVPPKTLQKLLGHGSLQMTMDLYCHVTQDTLFEEVERYEKLYSY